MEMGLFCLLLMFHLAVCNAEITRTMGINYGQLGNNLPSHSQSISLIQSLNADSVKLYDANPQILQTLSRTNLLVSIMVPNQLISNISASQSLADQWLRTNLLPFYPDTKIRTLLVGNEILSNFGDTQTWHDLVPAMKRLKQSLKSHGIRNIKVGTPLAMDMLQTSFPPSNGTFRSDIAVPVMRPLLQFLNRTKSFFFVDVYTYFPWSADPKNIGLDYALLRPTNFTYTDPGTGLVYNNLLDQMLDAVTAAMAKVGFPGVRLCIAETGWPNAGDLDQIGANIYNAAAYNRNLARKYAAKSAIGTPARPNFPIRAYIFSLYNENQKPGPGTERNWGLLYPNGTAVYEVDLTGKRSDSDYKPLAPATNNEAYKGKIWCVAAPEPARNKTALRAALTYACGQGNSTCDAIQEGKACFRPNSVVSHASYAFNSYWRQFRSVGGNCYFDGLAVQTTEDPSYGYCKYVPGSP